MLALVWRLCCVHDNPMTEWLATLSWLQICWLVYGVGAVLLILPVWRIERHAKKVDGASGWVTFGWLLLAFYGLLILGAVSLVKVAWHWIIS